MDTQRVVIRESPGVAKVVSGHCIVPLRPNSMLVKVKAVALNPRHGKLLDREPNTDRCVLRINYASVVEKVANRETTKK
jgi:NADPH:quinone reductase-like Zn-dependent oxidoreductase